MRNTFAYALMLAATLGLAACDKKSEDKAQDAQSHAESAQKQMDKAQENVNEAAKENAEAAQDSAEAKQEAAKEGVPAPATPVAPAPEAAPKN